MKHRTDVTKKDSISTRRFLRALKNDEFEPYFQPIVSASEQTIFGAEILVRWHLPTGDIIPATQFIKQAESAGVLVLITQKVLYKAVSKLLGMSRSFPQTFRLNVNVTPALLKDIHFVQMCKSLSNEKGVRFVLELTEQHPFPTDNQTINILNRLNDANVEFALDDFCTGFSSLSYLKYFPIRYIKIDNSFIQDILYEEASRHIIESMVSLAHNLKIHTVVEGVETSEQVDYLLYLSVDYFQGYFFGKPMCSNTFISKYL
ncbi:EAL domain-containing protein (plasmid) [Escherichia coli]|uniref:EAL domain-containing protein n=1 Tax=Escherichia coli TaxID=562 RepID=UPI002402CCAF|nr:EAL domain-containing protein [Escherichia coli]MDF8907418.1 EAL domain-containing protein [Escherichia coli]MDM5025328.1 EAL domain-containing protein [Escherichia coli]MDM5025636.1 EAL domain-containing protein [Escherichia coli]MDM5035585.1 EAL domain-containing protein [Escherichia coli]